MKRTRDAQEFLNTFGPYCGAPRPVFTGQFDVAVRAELRRLFAYATHHYWCYGTDDNDDRCTCGLRELRRYVDGGSEGTEAADAEDRSRTMSMREHDVGVQPGDDADELAVAAGSASVRDASSGDVAVGRRHPRQVRRLREGLVRKRVNDPVRRDP